MLVMDSEPVPRRDIMFQLPPSAVLAWASVRYRSLQSSEEWQPYRVRKTKSMKKSSGGNGSSLSKGKQLRISEGTWSTDAGVSLINYTGMMA